MPRLPRARKVVIRAAALLAAAFLATPAQAEPAAIQLTARPPRVVADGNSFATITAVVRDENGRLVADGEQVSFSATLGNIEPTGITRGGQATAKLLAPGIPGTAVITAACGRALAETRVVFAKPGAQEWRPAKTVVIRGDYLAYDDAAKTIDAIGAAFIEVGGVAITGDRAQVSLDSSSVITESRAGGNGTVVREGDRSFQTDKVRFDWQTRDGYALGVEEPIRGIHYFSLEDLVPVPSKEAFAGSPFELRQTGESPLTIKASRIVLEPGIEMVFNKAEIIIAGKKRFGLPVFVYSIGGAKAGDPRFIGFGPEGFLLDLPYTFAAGPKGIAQARLKYNAPEGLYGSYVAGWALDLIGRYASGGNMDGRLELSRVTSTDRGLSWMHNQVFNSRLQGYVSLDTRSPSGYDTRQTIGNLSLNYGARPYTIALSAAGTDMNVTTGDVQLSIQTRPKPLSKGLFWNVGAASSWSWYPVTEVDAVDPALVDTVVQDRNTTGVSARLSWPNYKVGKKGTLNASGSAGASWSDDGLKQTLTGSAGYAQRLGRASLFRATYNYSDLDQGPSQVIYTDPITGEPRIYYVDTVETQNVSASLTYGRGRSSIGAFTTYGIDQQSWNARIGGQHAIARDWTLQGSVGYYRQQLYQLADGGADLVQVSFSQTSWQVRIDRALGERALGLVYDSYRRRVYLEYVPGRLF